MRTVAAVIALVACVQAGLWAVARDRISAPDFDGQLASVSYAPFEGNTNAETGGQAHIERIRSDLKLLAPLTRAIRTYSATNGVELVPGIASEFGLRVTVGLIVSMIGAGHSKAELLTLYPYLEGGDIDQALAYAAWRVGERQLPLASA